MIYADGQTGMTKLIVIFRNYANAPKNICFLYQSYCVQWGSGALLCPYIYRASVSGNMCTCIGSLLWIHKRRRFMTTHVCYLTVCVYYIFLTPYVNDEHSEEFFSHWISLSFPFVFSIISNIFSFCCRWT